MKIITITKIGYNHPSQANWSWGIFQVSTIDTNGSEYQMSYTTKECFGGDTRLRGILNEYISDNKLDARVIETKGVISLPNITGVAKHYNMEDTELMEILQDFLSGKTRS